jgi:chemotaxis protein CheD
MANARMGELVVSCNSGDELMALGLGSCIGLAMVDRAAGVAGLAHVVLPDSDGSGTPAAKFADTAVPELLARVCEAGAVRSRLQVAIAGGASMFAGAQSLDIGDRNQRAIREALRRARLRCDAAETGGERGRTMRVAVGAGTVTSRTAGQEPIELLRGAPVRRAA